MVQQLRMLVLFLTSVMLAAPAFAQETRVYGQRDSLFIVTSTLTRAYVDAISDRYLAEYGYARPLVKTTLANVAVEAFCGGIGTEYPDVVAIPRRMSRKEFETCVKNGMIDVIELDIGKDALVVVTKKGDPVFDLKLKYFFYALAAEIPKDAGYFADFIPNVVQRWSEIEPTLPDVPIRILGPAKDTAILTFMQDFFMQGACRKIGAFKVYYNAEDRVRQCTALRTDGAYEEVPVPIATNFIEKMRMAPPGTLAVLPYTVWRNHRDWLDVLPVEGVEPNHDTIPSFDYVAVYPLRLYVKRAHMRTRVGGLGIVEGLFEFIHATMSEEAIGDGGYLESVGLVNDPPEVREENRSRALRLIRFVR